MFAVNSIIPNAYAQVDETSDITVHSMYSSGEIFGYYTVLSQGAGTVATSYTASTFSLNNGETYNVGVQDFGDLKFDYWQDTNSDVANRDVSINSDTDLYAVYRDVSDPSTDPNMPKLLVRTVNQYGQEITGYWTALTQGDTVVQTSYSPEGFLVKKGETYLVFMGNWDGVEFKKWSDGNTDNPRKFSIDSDTKVVAIYKGDAYPDGTKIKGHLVGKQNEGEWKAFGLMKIGKQFYKVETMGTYSVSGDGECKDLTGEGTINFEGGNSLDIAFEGEVCPKNSILKGMVPFEVIGGDGKFDEAIGEGTINLKILGDYFAAKIKGILEN